MVRHLSIRQVSYEAFNLFLSRLHRLRRRRHLCKRLRMLASVVQCLHQPGIPIRRHYRRKFNRRGVDRVLDVRRLHFRAHKYRVRVARRQG